MSAAILDKEGKRLLLMGNEAMARGALEAGVDLVAGYPGTPSSEVIERLWEVAEARKFYVQWSTNEKVAFEVAAGASLEGARTLCTMKNAGLNVAMDSFATLAYTGVRGGMVLMVADDPGAHYSSTEQDTRTLAAYAEVPCLEPCDQQEAKDMVKAAFDLSEELELPVMVRSVTRLSHASGDVVLGSLKDSESLIGFNKHYKIPYRWNVYGAPGAVSKHVWLQETLTRAGEYSEESGFNSLSIPQNPSKVGIIASGLGYAYVRDVLHTLGMMDKVNLLKIGFLNPLPKKKILELLDASTYVIVVEEGEPYIERLVRGIESERQADRVPVFGKFPGERNVLPSTGELTCNVVEPALLKVYGMAYPDCSCCLSGKKGDDEARGKAEALVTPRSSALCPGCPHLGSYWALNQALKREPGIHIINGDIGCYEQGGYGLFAQAVAASDEAAKKYAVRTPYETLDTLHVMGSGLGMAQGQAHLGKLKGVEGHVVAVSGDSTFFHAILPSIVNVVVNATPATYLVLDNRWTAMTGHQPSATTGENPLGQDTPALDIAAIVRAVGVKNVFEACPFDLEESIKTIKEALACEGPSVVILKGECTLQLARRKATGAPFVVDPEKCTGCRTCLGLGCPAITFDSVANLAGIDAASCAGCGMCESVCPFDAIHSTETGKRG